MSTLLFICLTLKKANPSGTIPNVKCSLWIRVMCKRSPIYSNYCYCSDEGNLVGKLCMCGKGDSANEKSL